MTGARVGREALADIGVGGPSLVCLIAARGRYLQATGESYR